MKKRKERKKGEGERQPVFSSGRADPMALSTASARPDCVRAEHSM